MRDMWMTQNQNKGGVNYDEDEEDEEAKQKKADRGWFKTTVKFEKDMEIFETEELGSDDD